MVTLPVPGTACSSNWLLKKLLSKGMLAVAIYSAAHGKHFPPMAGENQPSWCRYSSSYSMLVCHQEHDDPAALVSETKVASRCFLWSGDILA